MGTTKLTRKEILAEDPVHGAIITLVDFVRSNKKILTIVVAAAIVLIFGVYGATVYLNKMDNKAQNELGQGIEIYHAEVDPAATEDSYQKGSITVFKTDALKYQAAADKFSTLISGFGNRKVSSIARYYLGLTQLKLGEAEAALDNLRKVAGDSKEPTIGYLASMVLARRELESGNYEVARIMLEGMMEDKKTDLPKEETSIMLSKALMAEGKQEEAEKVLEKTSSEGSSYSSLRQKVLKELEEVRNTTPTDVKP